MNSLLSSQETSVLERVIAKHGWPSPPGEYRRCRCGDVMASVAEMVTHRLEVAFAAGMTAGQFGGHHGG